MLPIAELTVILKGLTTKANVRILIELLASFFTVKYATTTKSLSRYTEVKRRTIFRFLRKKHEWVKIRVSVFKALIFKEKHTYIAAIDEVVEGKSRKNSHGISKFYSSTAGKPINGICFFALALIDVTKRTAYTIAVEQVIYTDEDKARIKEKKEKVKAGKKRAAEGKALPKGRKKGSTDAIKEEKVNETASFRAFRTLWTSAMDCLKSILPAIKVKHLVADSAYGTLDYLNLAKANDCFLISVLSSNTALYQVPIVDETVKKKAGRPKMYGDRYDLKNLSAEYLQSETDEGTVIKKVYRFTALNKAINQLLNVVVVQTIRKADNKVSTNIWFTNDLELDAATLLAYYSLRFQIEFEFRDAKQHFGLSDFKNYKPENLTNFVNLSFLTCLISKPILEKQREELKIPKLSVIDLKTLFYQRFVAKSIYKLIREESVSISFTDIIERLRPTDLVNAA